MNTALKAKLEKAVNTVLCSFANDSGGEYWDGFIHPTLHVQMVAAAEQVFDAAMEGQDYCKRENLIS